MSGTERAIEIVEVAPRDGFQAVGPFIATDRKIAHIEALLDAGIRRMEIGSFVSPKAIPQLADTRDVVAAVGARAGCRLSVLVPNEKGARLAADRGVREIVWVLSASESHNRENVRRTVAESIEDLRRAADALADLPLSWRFNVATSYDCPFEGRTPADAVYAILDQATRILPAVEIGLCDSTGRAFPDQVGALCAGAMARFGGSTVGWAFHGHDTYGLGVANALAAWQAGVRVFDSSAAGLGGCPFAPGATGNTATEDLVFAFGNMGVSTGVDLAKLLPACDDVATIPGAAIGGHVRTIPRARVLSDRVAR